jgi:cell division septum initiation protein DivIVA
MSELSLKRADELLTELVELVETARTLPMSSSCVLPRERVLDLLDELRETLPVEIDEARRVIGNRDELLHNAYTEATAAREQATSDAQTVLTDAEQRAAQLVHDAEVQAHEILEAGRAEHGRLVSATGVHQAAAAAAAELRQAAERYDAEVRAQADAQQAALREAAERFDRETRVGAERYAAKLTGDAEEYADRTLAELAQTLQRAAHTAEQGRLALARRRDASEEMAAGLREVAEPSISA